MATEEKARQRAPGLPVDLLQWIVREESNVEKQDIGRITETQHQAILRKWENVLRTTQPGTEKSYYVYVEDEGGIYLETVDEKGVPLLVLNTETDKQLPTDVNTK